MRFEFEIGDVKVTVDGVPEGLRPGVGMDFHGLSVGDTSRVVAALGGSDALEPVRPGSVCLTARTGQEYSDPSFSVNVFPADEGGAAPVPSNPVVRAFWAAQQAANV